MNLPFTISLAPPARADYRSPRFWALVGFIVLVAISSVLLVRYARAKTTGIAPTATVAVTSTPAGATILVGDRAYGRTPITLALPPGAARITLRLDRYADITYRVHLDTGSEASLAGVLWPRVAGVAQVRPPLPGATIAGARFLADGRLVLVGRWHHPDRSLRKAAHAIQAHATRPAATCDARPHLCRAPHTPARCLAAAGRLNARKTAPSTAQLLLSLDPEGVT